MKTTFEKMEKTANDFVLNIVKVIYNIDQFLKKIGDKIIDGWASTLLAILGLFTCVSYFFLDLAGVLSYSVPINILISFVVFVVVFIVGYILAIFVAMTLGTYYDWNKKRRRKKV